MYFNVYIYIYAYIIVLLYYIFHQYYVCIRWWFDIFRLSCEHVVSKNFALRDFRIHEHRINIGVLCLCLCIYIQELIWKLIYLVHVFLCACVLCARFGFKKMAASQFCFQSPVTLNEAAKKINAVIFGYAL